MKKIGLILCLFLATALMAQVSTNMALSTNSTPKDGIIHVNGTWITKGEVDKVIEMYRQQMMRVAPNRAIGEPPPEFKKNIAMQLVAKELLVQEVNKRHFTADKAKVDSIFNGIKRQFPDSLTMQKKFAAVGETEKTVRNQIREGIMVDSLMKTIFINGGAISIANAQDSLKRNELVKNYIDSLMNAAKITYADTTYKLSAVVSQKSGNDSEQTAHGLSSSQTQAEIDSNAVVKPLSKPRTLSPGGTGVK